MQMTNHEVPDDLMPDDLMPDDLMIVHNEPLQRWEARADHRLMGVAEYQRNADVLVFHHTEVSHELRGRGIASRLVQSALDDARAKHLEVVPHCSFVATYIRRHPEYKTLVPGEYGHLLGPSS
jgi:predicted GNAT family acetyltransferase